MRAKTIPDVVSKKEYDEDMLTHLPYRNWCSHCVAGKCREDGHFIRTSSNRANEVPRISMDYCFLGRALKNELPKEAGDLKKPESEDQGLLPVLVMVDQTTGCTFSAVVTKGVNPYALHTVTEGLKFLGRQGKAILMTDGEHAIKALAEAAAKEMKGLQLQHAPKGSHASNGAAERAILEVARQVRTLVHALETRYPGYRLKTEGHVFPWLVRHAGWLITRFLVKDDGRTPYERLRGRDYKGEIVDYAEVVHYKLEAAKVGKLDPQASVGVWLGKSLSSDEHLIVKESEDAAPSGGGQRTRGGSKPDSMRLLEHRGSPRAASRLSLKTISDSPRQEHLHPVRPEAADNDQCISLWNARSSTDLRQDARDVTARMMIPRSTVRRAVFVLRASTRRVEKERLTRKVPLSLQMRVAPLSRAPNGQALMRAAPLRKGTKQPLVPRI